MRTLAVAWLLVACAKPAPPTVSRAAIAFRDDVPGYQKLASEKYALHYLEGAYEAVEYLEATPTDDGQTRLLAAITGAAAKHDTIDLFFLSNGNRYDSWVSTLPRPVLAKLHLVYNTGAGDARQGSTWLSLGARAYVGHPGGNVAPLFLTYFLPSWVKGVDLRKAVDEANKQSSTRWVRRFAPASTLRSSATACPAARSGLVRCSRFISPPGRSATIARLI